MCEEWIRSSIERLDSITTFTNSERVLETVEGKCKAKDERVLTNHG